MAYAGSVVFATLAFLPAGASADSPSTPAYSFSSASTAVGLQIQLDSNPEPTPVPDLTDVEVPTSNSLLDSFGRSDATGDIGNLNGLGKVPGLVCLAAGGACDSAPLSTLVGLVDPSPLEAAASVPDPLDATAPVVDGHEATVSGGSTGFLTLSGGQAAAHARDLTNTAQSTSSGFSLLGALTVGAMNTTTTTTADADKVVTTAVSTVSDVDLGTGLLHIGSIQATATTTSAPGQDPVDTSSISVAGVTVAGQSATIDNNGVHLTAALPAAITTALQTVLGNTLKADGVALTTGGVTRSDGDDGHTVTAEGLVLTLDTPLGGLPPVNVGLPAGVPCPLPDDLPVSPCSGVGLNLNGEYHGQVVLGEAGLTQQATTGTEFPGLGSGVSTLPGSTPGTIPATATGTSPAGAPSAGGPAATGGGTPATTVGGSPLSSAGQAAVPQAATGGTVQTGAAAPTQVALVRRAEPLDGVAKRLRWLLLALLVGGIGALAGRRGVPARLPRG